MTLQARPTFQLFLVAVVFSLTTAHGYGAHNLVESDEVVNLDVTQITQGGELDAAEGISELVEEGEEDASNDTTPPMQDGAGNYTTVAEDALLPPILTPSLRNQEVTKLRLQNGMGVYIVSDDQLESSAMGVGVEVGSWSDPDNALGMAHFVEHMMFMGTKQHPEPGNFDEFLAANGAQISNAATGSASTCYAFSTPHEAFKAGISRFAEFFTDPLFDSHGAAKEMHAVNQEFEMHKDEDGYRQYMVSKQLANPTHPMSRFTIGNLDTLSKVDNAQLVKWYQAHYSSNLMHVAVFTALPAAEIIKLVSEKFANVANRHYTRLTTVQPSMQGSLLRKVVHTKPERDVRSLSLEWELSPFFAHKRLSQPDRMVSYVLGDEGPGSLTTRLREKHLALSVSVGMSKPGRDNAIFSIELSLTEKGMEQRDTVVSLVFKAIHGLKKLGIPKYVWDEAHLRDVNGWQLQERTGDTFDAAMGEVRQMFNEPLESYPRTQSILQEYDPEGVTDILHALVPRSVHLSQMGGIFPPPNMEGTVQNETFYKAKFAIEVLPDATIRSWEQVLAGEPNDAVETYWPSTDDFKLPPPNPYLDATPTVGTIDPTSPVFPALPQPRLAVDEAFGKLYVGEDKAFGDPYILASVQVKTAAGLVEKYGPKARVMTNLFVDCLGEAIKPVKYPFEIAGLGAALSMGKGTNLFVSVSGKVPVKSTYMALLQVVLKNMKEDFDSYTSQETFEMVRKAVLRYYSNKLKSGARATAGRMLWNTLSNSRTPVEVKIEIAESVTFEEVKAFVPELLAQIKMEGFAYGRLSEADALDMYRAVEQTLKPAPAVGKASSATSGLLSEAEEFVSKMRVLPEGSGPWYIPTKGSARSNATILLIDGGHLPCDEAMALPLLYKEVGNMFFKELRTKQQTGYVASAYATTVARRTVVLMLVESSWAGAGDLLKRFEAFNTMVLQGVNDGTVMPASKLESIRSSMLSGFEKPIQNIGGMASILEGIIKEYDGDFNAEKKKKLILERMTRDTIVQVANKVLHPNNKRRFAVLYSPDGVPTDTTPDPYALFTNGTGTFQAKPKYSCDICVTGCSPPPAPHNQTHSNQTQRS